MTKAKRLDEILLLHHWVTEAQLVQALGEQKESGSRLGTVLVQLGFLTETQLSKALAEQYGVPAWDPEKAVLEMAALELLPDEWILQKGVLPVAYNSKKKRLNIAVTDPTNQGLIDEIRERADVDSLEVTVIPEISLKRAWQRYQRQKTDRLFPSGDHGVTAGANDGDTPLTFDVGTQQDSATEKARPRTGVLLWLSQPSVAKLFISLLEAESCIAKRWDGQNIPGGQWQYVVYDDDRMASQPHSARRLKEEFPHIQFIPRPSWVTTLLRSPLSYDQLRDGYIHLAEFVSQQFADGRRDRRLSRYALAAARMLPMTQFEIDSLMAACELAPLLAVEAVADLEWKIIADELRCPYPVIEIYRGAAIRFDQSETAPGESGPSFPLAAKVYAVANAFLRAADRGPVDTIESLSELTSWLRRQAGQSFDPLVVEAMLRVVQEDVLDGCLPPGPSEVILVADRPIEWDNLVSGLKKSGWRVVKSHGAAEARRQVERRQPDAVVWAAGGAMEWIRNQENLLFGVANFLILNGVDADLERAALEAGYEDVWGGKWDAGVALTKLQRAVARREKTEGDAPAVSGSLRQLSFIDMVQVLTAGSRSVRIEITNSTQVGVVVLWEGRIAFAQVADKEGEPAIYDILSWDDGTFKLHPVYAEPPTNCALPNDVILLEGCRLLDENSREPAAVTS